MRDVVERVDITDAGKAHRGPDSEGDARGSSLEHALPPGVFVGLALVFAAFRCSRRRRSDASRWSRV